MTDPHTDPATSPPDAPPAPSRRGRILLFVGVLVFLGLAAALAIIEVGVRVSMSRRPNDIEALRRYEARRASGSKLFLADFVRPSDDAKLIYELIPNVTGEFRRQSLRTNAAGFRDVARALAKPPGTVRVAVLGDSVAFGWGVAEEDRYSNVLERALNETTATASAAATKFEVLNFGVPGYNTALQAAQLRARVAAYNPDAIVLGFVTDNDASLPNFLSRAPDLWTLRRSYAAELLQRGRTATMGLEPGLVGVDVNNVPPEFAYLLGWDACYKALSEIGDFAKERKIPVVILPDFWDVNADGSQSGTAVAQTSEVLQRARAAGYLVADARLEIASLLRANQWHGYALSVDADGGDAHPNAARHAAMAHALDAVLRPALQLPPAPAQQWEAVLSAAARRTVVPQKWQLGAKTP